MADVVPFLIVAAIKGSYELRKLAQRLRLKMRPMTIQRIVLVGMLASSLTFFVVFNPFTFIPREPYAPIYGWESGASLAGLRAVEHLIPPDSCLTASDNIAAHYGQRKYIYVFGIGNWSNCDLSLVDLTDTRYFPFGRPQTMPCQHFNETNYQPIF